jgi:wyosine [tRNA(Phe)-imidazoG37] synthetase (radical SAM superfamily)
MMLELQKNIIYGPVNSRRLGRSLGINILPPSRKVCTLNCQYCQYGWTSANCLENKIKFPSADQIMSEFEDTLTSINPQPAYLTFSGNGEPTLHPEFEEIVDRVIWFKNKKAPHLKTAVLSNSTTVTSQKMRGILSRLDVQIMKMDVGNRQIFSRFNQPIIEIEYNSILNGLALLKNVTIQTLFSKGPEGNFDKDHTEDWIKAIKKMAPFAVQLYTLDRQPPSKKIYAVSPDELLRIHSRLKKENLRSEVF